MATNPYQVEYETSEYLQQEVEQEQNDVVKVKTEEKEIESVATKNLLSDNQIVTSSHQALNQEGISGSEISATPEIPQSNQPETIDNTGIPSQVAIAPGSLKPEKVGKNKIPPLAAQTSITNPPVNIFSDNSQRQAKRRYDY